MSDTEYKVFQFFPDDSYECVRDHVSAKEAVQAAHHYCHSVGALAGITRKVIITDGGDYCVFEWRFGEGIVYPTEEMRQEARREYSKGH